MATSEWTDELKATAVAQYLDGKPTAENTMDIVAEVAETLGKTVNGTRRILGLAKVYIAKGTVASTAGTADKPKRKSKQESIDELTAILKTNGVENDATVVDKLTGKAAEYFITVIKTLTEEEE